MTFDKDSEERAMFADFYLLCQKYWDTKGDEPDDYMDVFFTDVGKFCKKYDKPGNHFAKRLAGVLITLIRDVCNGEEELCKISKDRVVDTILRRIK